ncbi:MAG: aminopeptidase [Fimbriimonadales bacterium]|nr:MAG: aminopeptidase [Fimbriimonadales bacterium]
MIDPRVTKLAQMLCKHSTRLKKGDNVLIEAFDIPPDCVAELVRVAHSFGANVFVQNYSTKVQRTLLLGMTEQNARAYAEVDRFRMEKMDAYIALRGADNAMESSDVPAKKMKLWNQLYAVPVHFETRVPKTRWVVLRWPSPSMAQQAKMSTEAFEDFYFRVCTLDYGKMEKAVQPLKRLMRKTDVVEIKGPGTDLRFSIKGVGVVPCIGLRNIPDGECFTAPVKNSVNGTLQYNTDTLYQGKVFSRPKLTFKDGKIVDVDAGDATKEMKRILDTDEGARYIGEWSLGFNPYILHPMLDTLFDEKIAGSFHMTPGNAYDDADNGNRSAVHWDMVCIQRPEYGGGEIYFDGKLIRKDGLFVHPELKNLNPDKLGR